MNDLNNLTMPSISDWGKKYMWSIRDLSTDKNKTDTDIQKLWFDIGRFQFIKQIFANISALGRFYFCLSLIAL